jgi:flagellar basal-body rod modification protein FlgD
MTVTLPTQIANAVISTASTRAKPNSAAGASNNDDTSDSSSVITSSDFLTLLVSEMKNQDPTAPTDPTQYVQQLVGVNSLQQLIDINQTLSGVTSTSAS